MSAVAAVELGKMGRVLKHGASEKVVVELPAQAVSVPIDELVARLTVVAASELCAALGERLSVLHGDRQLCAAAFSSRLSDSGCRFLADVVTNFYAGDK